MIQDNEARLGTIYYAEDPAPHLYAIIEEIVIRYECNLHTSSNSPTQLSLCISVPVAIANSAYGNTALIKSTTWLIERFRIRASHPHRTHPSRNRTGIRQQIFFFNFQIELKDLIFHRTESLSLLAVHSQSRSLPPSVHKRHLCSSSRCSSSLPWLFFKVLAHRC